MVFEELVDMLEMRGREQEREQLKQNLKAQMGG